MPYSVLINLYMCCTVGVGANCMHGQQSIKSQVVYIMSPSYGQCTLQGQINSKKFVANGNNQTVA